MGKGNTEVDRERLGDGDKDEQAGDTISSGITASGRDGSLSTTTSDDKTSDDSAEEMGAAEKDEAVEDDDSSADEEADTGFVGGFVESKEIGREEGAEDGRD